MGMRIAYASLGYCMIMPREQALSGNAELTRRLRLRPSAVRTFEVAQLQLKLRRYVMRGRQPQST
jgi:hypothetical protein